MSKIFLVSCVALKQEGRHLAKDLYTSIWFGKAKAVVEDTGKPWYILSSLYGLVSPTSVIANYEKTLNSMKKAERLEWANDVIDSMRSDPTFKGVTEFVFLAGARYRENLIPLIRQFWPDARISVPMQGMQIGYQLQWLKENSLS